MAYIPRTKELVLGQTYTNKKGEQMTVLSMYSNDKPYYLVRFEDTGNLQYVNAQQIGKSFDKSKPFICGIGYFKCEGEPIMYLGGRMTRNNSHYICWSNMIRRCYDGTHHHKPWRDVTVCEEWHNFTNFYKWAIQQPFQPNVNIQLDKDLFRHADKREYSPETCCFLPGNLNAQLKSMTYEDIHSTTPSPRMRAICEHMALLLLKYDELLSLKTKEALWRICEVNGFGREVTMLSIECKKQKSKIEELEKEVQELLEVKTSYEHKDLNGNFLQEQMSLMPIKGYIQLEGKSYRIETVKDLYNMLILAKNTMLKSPKPQ